MYVCCMQEVQIKLKFMELIKTLEHKHLFKQASKAIKVKTTNTIILNPVFVHALELKLENFSELKRAMEQSCLEIHDLNLNRARLHKSSDFRTSVSRQNAYRWQLHVSCSSRPASMSSFN